MRLDTKTIMTALMTGALIAGGVVAGYAGGGGAGGPGGEIFFQCYPAVSGPNPPHVLEVNDQFINPTVENVGKLKMICSFNPTVAKVGENPPDLHVVQSPTIMTCYEATGATTKDDVVYTDTFFGDPQVVKVSGTSQLICVLGTADVTRR